MNILREVYYNQILPKLERTADEFCDPQNLVKVDLMEIDMDELPLNFLQSEFAKEVEKAFRQKLKQIVQKGEDYHINGIEIIPEGQSAFNLLSSFLQTGDIPWWVSNKKTLDINSLFLEVLKQNRSELKLLLQELSGFPEVVERIKGQFNKDSLKLIEQVFYDPVIILKSFLETGNLPWWAGLTQIFNINKLLSEVQKHNPENLKQLLVESSYYPDFRKRIQNQLDHESMGVIEYMLHDDIYTLEFYLRTGSLPPLIKDRTTLNPVDLVKKISIKSRKELEILFISLSVYPDVIKRIQHQFNDESILLIVRILISGLPADHQEVYKDLGKICESSSLINLPPNKYALLSLPVMGEAVTGKLHVNEFLGKIITILAEEQRKPIKEFYLELFLFLSDIAKLNLDKDFLQDLLMKDNCKEQVQLKSLLSKMQQDSGNLINVFLRAYQAAETNLLLNQNSALSEDEIHQNKKKINIPLVESKTIKDGISELSSVNAEKDRLPKINESYIDNAGVVLLWPYLEKLFRHLYYVNKDKFMNIRTKKRAIHMLHFLVWNKEDSPEYRLFLNKILCGYEISRPIERKVRFTKEEKRSATKLLEAVVKNWPALKNTSVAGLRETFLQRNGILTLKDNIWTLRVEQKTFDILMDRLPWSVSMVKLPWMDKPLYVEW
jgi:hypothetical protein